MHDRYFEHIHQRYYAAASKRLELAVRRGGRDAPRQQGNSDFRPVRAREILREGVAMKRRVMNHTLIEVVEELKTISTTKVGWIVPKGCTHVDAFLVGGGGGGKLGGGGGGFTKTILNIPVTPGDSIPYLVGSGGKRNSNGLPTYFGEYSAAGGNTGTGSYGANGGSGGSGGGGYVNKSGVTPGKGGSDGSNGYSTDSYNGGSGQRSSTICPFNNVMYAGGGGGGIGNTNLNLRASGGSGGGGSTGSSGKANTGGGGGAGDDYDGSVPSGSGGSGIIILHYFKYK